MDQNAMTLRTFAAGLCAGLIAALWAWLATLRGRVESRAEAESRAHQRGLEHERRVRQRRPTIRGLGGSRQPIAGTPPDPPAGGAAAAATQTVPNTMAVRAKREKQQLEQRRR